MPIQDNKSLSIQLRHLLPFWAAFFLSPFLWPYIHNTAEAFALLAFATGLAAAAAMWEPVWGRKWSAGREGALPWLWVICVLLPGFVLLLLNQARDPWGVWHQSLFIAASCLVFIFARAHAFRLFITREWVLLLAIVAHLYGIYAFMQWFGIRPFEPLLADTLFQFWSHAKVQNLAGPLAQENLHGLFLCLVLIAVFSRVVDASSSRWWPWWLLSLLPAVNLLGTGSRGSFIVFSLGVVALVFVSPFRRQAIIRVFSALLLAALLYWLLYELWSSDASSLSGQNGKTLVQAFQQKGVSARLFIWDLSLRLYMEHPWLGVGLGNLASYGAEGHTLTLQAHPEWADRVLYVQHTLAHSTPLQFFVEAGLIGGVAVLALYGLVFFRVIQLLRQGRSLSDGLLQGALGSGLILMHGLVSVSGSNAFFMVMFALYAAAAFPCRVNDV